MVLARHRVLLPVSLLGVLPGAYAQSVPPMLGADLSRSCAALVSYAEKGGPITVDATSCAAYVKGMRDAVDAPGQTARSPGERAFCATGAPLDDLARMIVKHVREHPDRAGSPASGTAIEALAQAYPCKRK